jgi:hypothetical protein
MVITELDKEWLESQTRKLSSLQRKLLREALKGYARRLLHLARKESEPGSFELKNMMWQFEKGRVRACARAAAGLSITRLMARGLLECCARGRWRLTSKGLEVALRLEPDFNLPTAEELAPELKLAEAINVYPRFARDKRRKARRTLLRHRKRLAQERGSRRLAAVNSPLDGRSAAPL